MLRRHFLTSLALTAVVAVSLGLVYPLLMTAIGSAVFPWRTNGSLIKRNGVYVGSALIGQNFLNASGNPDPRYFQPRPSDAGAGYDPTSSGASNLGPGDPRLVGFIGGFNTPNGPDGQPLAHNPFATKADPYCVPTDPTGAPVTSPSIGQKYAKQDGSYVCDPNTVPERVLAYRALNGLKGTVKIPVDAVTASGSGLDPDISVANARLQAPRVAAARHLPVATVMALIAKHTNEPNWGFLGEKTVNVLDLNLALNSLGS